MKKLYGMIVATNSDGSTTTKHIKSYSTYDEMIADDNPGGYCIVLNSNTVYHNTENGWVVGFANVINDDYYSAFEVMPNKIDIPSGTVDELTGLTYNITVPACTEHKMSIKSAQDKTICDVIVDWGDGTTTKLNDPEVTFNNGSYELSHDYASVMTTDVQRFVVKIYGKNYWAFRHNSYINNNLMSRIFAVDLPLAPHVANIASTCAGALRLLSVHFYNYYHRIENISSTFFKCKNLISVTGFGTILNNTNGHAGGTFEQCENLLETDFRYPAGVSSIGNTFALCKKLAMDINDLLPANGFECKTVSIGVPFSNCRALTGTNFANKLWNDSTVNWIIKPSGTTYPFTGSSLKDQVPTSWGGTIEM